MTDTKIEFAEQMGRCREVFEKKLRDYGTSWRIMRLPSLTDQIYIKAARIRQIEESGENRVGDGVESEFAAMVNYAVMALILNETPVDKREDIDCETALRRYDEILGRTRDLMMDKNHDYSESWRMMRVSSMVDIILTKILRIKQIEDNSGHCLVSEGVEGGYMDIANYSLFCLIRLQEEAERPH